MMTLASIVTITLHSFHCMIAIHGLRERCCSPPCNLRPNLRSAERFGVWRCGANSGRVLPLASRQENGAQPREKGRPPRLDLPEHLGANTRGDARGRSTRTSHMLTWTSQPKGRPGVARVPSLAILIETVLCDCEVDQGCYSDSRQDQPNQQFPPSASFIFFIPTRAPFPQTSSARALMTIREDSPLGRI